MVPVRRGPRDRQLLRVLHVRHVRRGRDVQDDPHDRAVPLVPGGLRARHVVRQVAEGARAGGVVAVAVDSDGVSSPVSRYVSAPLPRRRGGP